MDALLTTMTTEDLLIQNGRYWQTVEAVSESFPQPNVVTSFTYNTSNSLML